MEKSVGTKKKNDITMWAGISLVASSFFMLFIYAPLEMYFYNRREFWFDVYCILPLCIVLFVIAALVFAGIILLIFRVFPKLYKYVLLLGSIVFVSTYIQGNFLVGNLPPTDGTSFDWADYSVGRLHSIVLWIVVTLVISILFKFVSMERFCYIVNYASIFMILTLSLTLISICITTRGYVKSSDTYGTSLNEYEFSTDKNFIVLLLDAADSGELYEMMQENEAYKEVFQDFTYYRNTMGAYTCTKYAIPQIIGGQWYENEQIFENYCIDAYANSPLFRQLEEQGYQMSLYESEMPSEWEGILKFDNVISRKSRVTSYLTLAKLEIKLVGLRYAPFDLKKFCTFKMVEFASTRESDYEYPVFAMDNKMFYDRLNASEVSYSDEKRFKFIHIDGAHASYDYDKELNAIENGVYRDAMEASMTITEAYLNKLKDAGVYDNSVIIVMADHGMDGDCDSAFTGRQNPVFLVKGINEQHEMQISEVPISYQDLQDIYAGLLQGRSSTEISDYQEGGQRERRFMYYEYWEDNHIYEYVQDGHASNDDMRATGKEFIY